MSRCEYTDQVNEAGAVVVKKPEHKVVSNQSETSENEKRDFTSDSNSLDFHKCEDPVWGRSADMVSSVKAI